MTGLAVPLGWERAGDLQLDPSGMEEFLSLLLRENNLQCSSRVTLDQKTGLLIRITVGTNLPEFLYLSSSPERFSRGEYESGFSDLRAAIAVQHLTSNICTDILGATGDRRFFSYIAGGPGHYGPAFLEIPKAFLKATPEKPVTTPEYQESFFQKAAVFARQFGLSLASCEFDEAGRLRYFEVKPGINGTYYLLDSSGRYGEHNVDTSKQAAALQAIGATFVNDLWERLEPLPANP